jgi:hypothetical protein
VGRLSTTASAELKTCPQMQHSLYSCFMKSILCGTIKIYLFPLARVAEFLESNQEPLWIPSVRSHEYIRTCGKGLHDKVEERGGVDAIASSKTNDKEIVRNPFSPFGLGRDGPDLVVVPPRRYDGIDSSSRLDLRAVALPISMNVFMTQDTSVRSRTTRNSASYVLNCF